MVNRPLEFIVLNTNTNPIRVGPELQLKVEKLAGASDQLPL